jgi:hypothetical protein
MSARDRGSEVLGVGHGMEYAVLEIATWPDSSGLLAMTAG